MLRRHLLPLPLWPALAGAAPAVAREAPPSADTAAISPSGAALAYVAARGSGGGLVIRDFITGRALLGADLGALKVERIQWAGEGHIVLLAQGAGGRISAFVLDVERRRLTRLLGETPRAPQTVVGAVQVRRLGDRAVVWIQSAPARGGRLVSLMRADLEPLVVRLVAAGEPRSRGWVVDAAGQPAATELYDPSGRRWSLRVRTPDGWREAHAATGPAEAFRLLGLARDGRAVLYGVREPGSGWTWREARLDGAAAAEPLTLGSAAEPLHDPQDGRVIGYRQAQGYGFFDPGDAAAWKLVTNAFPGDRVRLASWSDDRRRVVALVEPADDDPGYVQVDLAARVANWIGPGAAGRARASSGAAPDASGSR